jgi:hypothetical protein
VMEPHGIVSSADDEKLPVRNSKKNRRVRRLGRMRTLRVHSLSPVE